MTLYTVVLIIHGFAALFGLRTLVMLALKPASHYQKLLTVTSICCFLGLVAYLMELMSTNLREALLAAKFGYIGKSYAMMLFLIFMATYCGFKVPMKIIYCLLAFSTVTLMFVFLCNHHTLYYTTMEFTHEGLFPHLVLGKGVVYYIFMSVTIITTVTFVFIAVVTMSKQKGQERRRIGLLLFTGLVPSIALVLNLTKIMQGFDPTPIGMLISCMLTTYNVQKYGLLDTMQLATNSIMDITDRGIVVVNRKNGLIFANNIATSIFPELEGRDNEKVDVLMKIFDGVDQGNVQEKTFTVNNTIYGVNYSVLKENVKEGKEGISGYMAWIVDITAEYNYTKELERLRHTAEEANNAKTEFLARMSHEIRTPMNGIMGFAELALENDIDDETREYVEYIKSSSISLLGIVNDVLDISKIESGKMEIIELDYSPEKMFKDLAAVMETQAELKNLKFNFNMDDNIPGLVYGDKKRFGEILTNILGNAIKYTKQGKVDFNVGIRATSGDRVIFEIHVVDTGVGIKPENLHKIFHSFEQFDGIENYHVEGTGLGLSIAKQLAELMGGDIVIDSTYGKGSDFCIIIPQKVISGTVVGHSSDEVYRDVQFVNNNIRALVVDDNQINLRVEKGILEQYNMSVTLAMSGNECLEYVEKNKFDIIFMDHMMPGMDGVETMKKVRDGATANKDIPIILVTANAIVGVKEQMLDIGFDGFVSKPIIKEELLQELIRLLPMESSVMTSGSGDATEEGLDEQGDIEKQLADIGLDVEMGIKYCGDMEFYKEILQIAVDTAPDKLKSLKESVAAEDYKNFTIVVHSVKSNAANIGAMELSDAARELEMAGKRDDVDYILGNIDALLKQYEDMMNAIYRIVYPDKGSVIVDEKEVYAACESDEMDVMLRDIQYYINELESDRAVEIAKKVLDYNVSDDMRASLENIIKNLDGSDVEEAKVIIKTLIEQQK